MAREIDPERNAFVLPVVANLVLVSVAAIVFLVAFANYREQVRRTELNESRFITLEWNLLRELKSETDRQLHEKDQEILALRLRYLELASTRENEADLRAVELQLRQAERERDLILQNRLAAAIPSPGRFDKPAPAVTPPRAALDPVVDPERAVEPDRVEIDSETERVAVLERAIEAERGRTAKAVRDLERLAAELDDRRRADRLAAQRVDAAATALRGIESGAQDVQPTQPTDASRITMEHLSTRALVRAIIAAQPIRAEHPDLPEAFEGFIEATERAAVQRGRDEAYRDAVRTVEAVQRELGIPVSVAPDPDSATLFRVHLVALVESALRYGNRSR